MNHLNRLYYFIVIFLIVMLVYTLPTAMEALNKLNIDNLEDKVILALNSDSPSDELDEIVETSNLEIAVEKDDFYYSTLNIREDDLANSSFPSNMYFQTGDENGYAYTIVIPQLDYLYYINYLTIILLIIVIVLFVWLTLSIRNITRTMYRPLQRLRNNIHNLRNYEFNSLGDEGKDKINEELVNFSKDLSDTLITYNKELSSSERKELESINKIESQKEYLATTIHDIKNNLIEIQNINNDEDIDNKLNTVIKESEISINHYFNNDIDDEFQKKEVNIRDLVFNLISDSNAIIQNKEISVCIKIKDEYIAVNEILIKQLINNLVSNMIKYTPEFGEIDIELNDTILSFKNSVDSKFNINKVTGERFLREDSNNYSFGMFRIRNIVEELGLSMECKEIGQKLITEINLGALYE